MRYEEPLGETECGSESKAPTMWQPSCHTIRGAGDSFGIAHIVVGRVVPPNPHMYSTIGVEVPIQPAGLMQVFSKHVGKCLAFWDEHCWFAPEVFVS